MWVGGLNADIVGTDSANATTAATPTATTAPTGKERTREKTNGAHVGGMRTSPSFK